MNILAITDLFLPADVMRAALSILRPTHIHVIEWYNKDLPELHHRVRHIEQHGPDVEPPPDAVWDYADRAELIVTHLCPIGERLIERASKLRMIGVCRAGTETIACQAAQARGIAVYNVPGRNATAVAEFTVGLMLAERRNIARAHHAVVGGGWRKTFCNHEQDTELVDKVVGIVGFGAIGQMVAERLIPFRVRLLVHDPLQSPDLVESCGGCRVDLDELLARSDVVSLHARRDKAEPPLIGNRELGLMKPSAYLINTARAHLVDNLALIEALEQRRIGGAAIDVFENEPIDVDSPLRGLDNVTLTPHLAGSTREAFHRSPTLLVEIIRQAHSGIGRDRT